MAQRRIGPNDLCPCGSGKKHKRCCQGAASSSPVVSVSTPALTGSKFRYEPGSYGGHGMFAAAISCLKQVQPDEWAYHFVLANSDFAFEEEQEAVAAAQQHLEEAAAEKARTGSDAAFAGHLSGLGYLKVEDFRVIDERHDE